MKISPKQLAVLIATIVTLLGAAGVTRTVLRGWGLSPFPSGTDQEMVAKYLFENSHSGTIEPVKWWPAIPRPVSKWWPKEAADRMVRFKYRMPNPFGGTSLRDEVFLLGPEKVEWSHDGVFTGYFPE